MLRMIAGLLLVIASLPLQAACPPLLDLRVRTLASEETVHLCERYAGKVLLVVNTASKFAFTDQYEGLEKLYDRYRERGLVVLGFPSNDFLGQEPGTEKQIQEFCRLTYGVEFPMFEKTRVKAPDAHPFYESLARETGKRPRWNFHKYLISRDGRAVGSFGSTVAPTDKELIQAIEAEIAKPAPAR